VVFGIGEANLANLDRSPGGDRVGTWKSTTGSSGYIGTSVDDVDGETVRGFLYMAVAAPDTQGYYDRDHQRHDRSRATSAAPGTVDTWRVSSTV
jgi:hypothetical protein